MRRPLKEVAREELSAPIVSVCVAIVAIAASLLVIQLSGHSASQAASVFWSATFSGDAFQGTLQTMVPLTIAGLAWTVAFSAKRINVGLEGQILVGGAASAVVALQVPNLPAVIHLPLAVLAGIGAGGAWAGIAAALSAYRGVNEIIPTFMLNFIGALLVNYLVLGPLQEPTKSFPQTDMFPSSARLPAVGSSLMTWDILYVPIAVAAVAFFFRRTTMGFRFRVTGASIELARRTGMRPVRVGAAALTASGALAGLVGSSLVLSSSTNAMQENFAARYGFDGIAVGLLARNSPLACVPAALLLAALRQGGASVAVTVGVSNQLVQFTQGLIIVLMATAVFLRWRPRVSERSEDDVAVEADAPEGAASDVRTGHGTV